MGDRFLDWSAGSQVCGHSDAKRTERGACSPFIQAIQCIRTYRHAHCYFHYYVQPTYGMSQRSGRLPPSNALTPDSRCPEVEA